MYLGKEYTEQQMNQMDCTNVNTLLNRYESVLSPQMTHAKRSFLNREHLITNPIDLCQVARLCGLS